MTTTIRSITTICCFALLTCAAVAPACAQSTNARPVVIVGTAAVDPASLPLLTDEARKALTDDIAQMKSGAIGAFVLSASVDGKYWAIHTADKAQALNLEDMARQSLETCEYGSGVPCLILSVNGHDARSPNGGWPLQPAMFAKDAPAVFDADRVPFVSLIDRGALRGYAAVPSPRVLAVTTIGGWLWRTGKTIFEATAAAGADCRKTYPNQTCLLYAVNDKVVMAQ